MNGSGMGMLRIGGLILILLGGLGFAIPIFSTEQTKDVATLGDLKLQTTESKSYVIPPTIAGGALIVGVLLLGASLYRRQ